MEFIPTFGNDDSRASDGRSLRIDFFRSTRSPIDWDWVNTIGCSFLELILALSFRLEFQTGEPYDRWFWILLGNLGIDSLDDSIRSSRVDKKVWLVCNRINTRGYNHNGEGGLFPLKHTDRDVRDYDLWYQMSLYLQENIDM